VSQKIATDEGHIQMSDPQNQTSESREVGVAKNYNRRPLMKILSVHFPSHSGKSLFSQTAVFPWLWFLGHQLD
jgi:hypothetical protein